MFFVTNNWQYYLKLNSHNIIFPHGNIFERIILLFNYSIQYSYSFILILEYLYLYIILVFDFMFNCKICILRCQVVHRMCLVKKKMYRPIIIYYCSLTCATCPTGMVPVREDGNMLAAVSRLLLAEITGKDEAAAARSEFEVSWRWSAEDWPPMCGDDTLVLAVNTFVSANEPVYSSLSQSSGEGKPSSQFSPPP